jgi:hypothetical protein
MSRNLQASVNSASNAQEVRFRLLIEVYSVTGGPTRACNGYHYVQYNSNTYSPVGGLGGVDAIQEESDIFPRAVRIWFAAVQTTQIQDVLNETMFNCPVNILRSFLTDSLTTVASAELLFKGYINTVDMKLKDPEKGDHFTVEVESRLARPPVSQYFNRETLQYIRNYVDDTFFNYVHLIPFTKASWGRGLLENYSDPIPPSLRDARR